MVPWDESKRLSNLRDHGLDFVEPYEARYYLEAAEAYFDKGHGR